MSSRRPAYCKSHVDQGVIRGGGVSSSGAWGRFAEGLHVSEREGARARMSLRWSGCGLSGAVWLGQERRTRSSVLDMLNLNCLLDTHGRCSKDITILEMEKWEF